jgi:hypothetical protein
MQKLLPALAFLTLSGVVALSTRPSAPSLAAQAGAQGLEARVAALEGELTAEKKRHDETRALLEQTVAYLEKETRAGQALLGALDQCEQQGFAVGENWLARQTLLVGMRSYWSDLQTGVPKLPAPSQAKPAAPARPARVREE